MEDMAEPLVRVFIAASPLEGQIVKGRLEVEGIPVLIKGEGEGPYRMGPVELYVAANLEPHARFVLASTVHEDDHRGDEDTGSHGDRGRDGVD
jgi:hypothetical protein